MTYLIGIDVSKYKHDCLVTNSDLKPLFNTFTIKNNSEGFRILLNVLKDLKTKGEIKIGFESTGHYAINLKLFLAANDYTFMEFNPLLVKDFIKSETLRRTKTDKADAMWITKYLNHVEYKPYDKTFYHLDSLKALTRLRHSLIVDRSKYMIRITNVLDRIFPEIKPYFNEKFTPSLLYLLDNYLTPEHIKNLKVESYNKMKSELKNPISYQRFCEVKELAKNTVGIDNAVMKESLRILLSLYHNIDDQIKSIEKDIEAFMNASSFKTKGIKGVGIQTAAVIVSEIGDFKKFSSPSKLQAFIGIDPSKEESGTGANAGHMVKHGSSHLRYAVMNAAEMFYVHNPVISDFYWKKRNEGKAHRVALTHVARKLVSIIHFLETNEIDFDPKNLK